MTITLEKLSDSELAKLINRSSELVSSDSSNLGIIKAYNQMIEQTLIDRKDARLEYIINAFESIFESGLVRKEYSVEQREGIIFRSQNEKRILVLVFAPRFVYEHMNKYVLNIREYSYENGQCASIETCSCLFDGELHQVDSRLKEQGFRRIEFGFRVFESSVLISNEIYGMLNDEGSYDYSKVLSALEHIRNEYAPLLNLSTFGNYFLQKETVDT